MRFPTTATRAALHAAALRIFEPPMDRGRPLWEMHLFTGLEGERSAVLWRIHHCIVDGVSWAETLNTMLDSRRDAPAHAQVELPEPKPLPNATKRLIDAAYDLASMQRKALRRILRPSSARAMIPLASSTIRGAIGTMLRPTIDQSTRKPARTKKPDSLSEPEMYSPPSSNRQFDHSWRLACHPRLAIHILPW